jgi:hypothetical protein
MDFVMGTWRGDDTASLPNKMNGRCSRGKQHVLRDLLLTNISKKRGRELESAWELVREAMSRLPYR